MTLKKRTKSKVQPSGNPETSGCTSLDLVSASSSGGSALNGVGIAAQDVPDQKILIECKECTGSGLYKGFCEPRGQAVVCLSCHGQGAREFMFKPFLGRRKKSGVQAIRRPTGRTLLTAMGGTGPIMSYEQFEEEFPVKYLL